MPCPHCGTSSGCSHSAPRGAVALRVEGWNPTDEEFNRMLAAARRAYTPAIPATGPAPGPAPAMSPATEAPVPYTPAAVPAELEPAPALDDSFWRAEVSRRLAQHRSRRRRDSDEDASLRFDFDGTSAPVPYEPGAQHAYEPAGDSVAALVYDAAAPYEGPEAEPPRRFAPLSVEPQIAPAKVIEFPRPTEPAPTLFEELAEPVFEQPRILEAPPEIHDITQPEFAIRLDDQQDDAAVPDPDLSFELPLPVAGMGARIYAGLVDALVALTASAVFLSMVLMLLKEAPPGKLALAGALALPLALWSLYQVMFVVWCRTTPGMEMARLELVTFKGGPLTRGHLAARAAATVLSAASLGLGFAWAWVDEDHLCWHDRISRTYLQQG